MHTHRERQLLHVLLQNVCTEVVGTCHCCNPRCGEERKEGRREKKGGEKKDSIAGIEKVPLFFFFLQEFGKKVLPTRLSRVITNRSTNLLASHIRALAILEVREA